MKTISTIVKNNKPLIKGLVIMTVLVLIVFVPIISNANTSGSEFFSDNDTYHGHLELTASDITIPSKSNITEQQILSHAKPVATQVRPYFDTRERVDGTFSISESELAKVNSAKSTASKVTVTINGLYKYYCDNPSCMRDYHLTGETQITIYFNTPSYKVTFNANGGIVDGQREKVIIIDNVGSGGTTLGYLSIPINVQRKGYTFKGWSTSVSSFSKFTNTTVINGDMTVYAHWEKETSKVLGEKSDDKIDKPKVDKKVDNITQTRNSLAEVKGSKVVVKDGNKDVVLGSGLQLTKAEFVSLAQSQSVPVASIGNGSVPLYAPDGAGGWAFVNLMLSLIGGALVLISVILSFTQKRNKRALWFIVSIIASVVNLIVFFATQDLSMNMVLTDSWTVVNTILFAIVMTGVIKSLKKKNDKEEYIYNY